MKTKILVFALFAVAFLAGCGDDEKPALKKAYSYDGKRIKIAFATVDTDDLADGNYNLEFGSEGEEDYIQIQLSAEWDGQKVDLSEVDDDFDWSWYVYFERKEGDTWVDVLEGFGYTVEDFGDVESGELSIELVDADEYIFDVKLSLTTTDGENFKLNYKGEFLPTGGAPARKNKK